MAQMDAHMDECFLIAKKLDFVIKTVMRFIFEGRCQDQEEAEYLFKAVSRAIFMKELIEDFRVNLFTISKDFLEQFDEWVNKTTDPILN